MFVNNISVKEVLSDTNQFELPLINSGTQDFVVDWGDGEQDKITAWDDAAKLHSYYSYGSELVTNGDFSTSGTPDSTSWSLGWTDPNNSGNISISNGQLSINRITSSIPVRASNGSSSNNVLENNKTYKLTYTVVSNDTGTNPADSLKAVFGGGNTSLPSSVGPHTVYAKAGGTFFTIRLDGQNNSIIVLDNVSVVEQTPDTTPKTISIDGTIQGWQFNASGDYLKLNNINRWGALDIHNTAMFRDCYAMTCTATDAPVVTTTNFYRMFRACNNFNGAIGNWDVSGVTNLSQSLMYCINFNQPLNNWDVSSVSNFIQMFHGATNFAQDLNDWQINNSEIVTMYAMFYNCPNFNGDIYSWDTSAVWNMSLMLYNCDSFDQSLAAWNIENVTDFGDISGNGFMRRANGLSTSNYNLTLVSWAHQNVNSGLAVDFGGSQYSAGGAAAASRNILTSAPNNWTISDGGSV
jgi:surface protein